MVRNILIPRCTANISISSSRRPILTPPWIVEYLNIKHIVKYFNRGICTIHTTIFVVSDSCKI